MPLFNHFDLIAPFYDRLIKAPSTERLLKLANLPVNGCMLDAGGGTGRISSALKDYVSEVVIVDSSYKMLMQAKDKGELKLICAQTEKMPFPDAHFDRIIMSDALHHVSNQRTTALELWRLLKPKGRIVIEEPNIEKASVKIVAMMEKVAMMQSKFIPPKHIAQLFHQQGALIQIVEEGYNSWVIVDKLDEWLTDSW